MFENHIKSLAFNIASEPSSVYILTEQKFIKNAKKNFKHCNVVIKILTCNIM